MTKTGIVYHKNFLLHQTGSWHPERPERLSAIMDHLTKTGLINKLTSIDAAPADREWVATIHSQSYIDSVKLACEQGYSNLDPDTGIVSESFDVAMLAVGGALAAGDAVMNQQVENVFCALRPPGHHAERNRARGFCLFNNIAILAKYLQIKHHIGKILIIDWDVHHGNGTQYAFYDDPTVFYFSIHQYPYFPGSGSRNETGIDDGEGFTMNFPLSVGHGDGDYIGIFRNYLVPAADKFKPDFILISAGFDAHEDDYISGMHVTDAGFKKLSDVSVQIAEKHCKGKIISLLEGGYHLNKLAKCVELHIESLLNRGT